MSDVSWSEIESDVDEDGCVPPMGTFDDDEGRIGIETRYGRLESAYATDLYVGLVADPGGDGLVEIRVPWETLEGILAQRRK